MMLSEIVQDICLRDQAVESLAVALDPLALRQTLKTHFPDQCVGELRLEYVRYKPNQSCVVQIRYELDGQSVGGYVKAHGSHRWSEHHAAAGSPRTEDDAYVSYQGVLGVSVPSWRTLSPGLTLHVFPYDRRLRVERFLQPAHDTSALLCRLTERHPDAPNLHRALRSGAYQIRTLAYKPERRCVLGLFVENTPRATIKVYGDDRFDSALTAARQVANLANVRVSRLVGKSRRHRALAFTWIEGVSPSAEQLQDGTIIRDIARALASVRRHSASPLPAWSFGDAKDRIDRLVQDLCSLCPGMTSMVTQTGSALISALARCHEPSVLCHGDFHLDQIVSHEGQLGILDFDSALIGPKPLDVTNLISQLHYLQLIDHLPDTMDPVTIGSHLIDAYACRQESTRSPTEWNTWIALGLWNLVPTPFRRQIVDWPQTTERLLSRVGQLLDSTSEVNFGRVSTGNPSAAVRTPLPCSPVSAAAPPSFATAVSSHTESWADLETMGVKRLDRALDCTWMAQRILMSPTAQSLLAHHRLADATVVRVKSGRRMLIRYRWEAGGEEPAATRRICLLGKIRAKGFDRRAFALQQQLWQNGFSNDSRDRIGVARPVAAIPELKMWLQHEVSGQTADERLRDARNPSDAQRIADALAKLHATTVSIDRCHTWDAELAILEDRLALLGRSRPELAKPLQQVLTGCRRIVRLMDCGPEVLLHRDFYQDQILLDSHFTTLIDLDLAARGPAAIDVGNFVAHLMELGLRCHDELGYFDRYNRAFVDRYRAQSPWCSEEDVARGTTLSLARHLYLSTQFHDRRHTTMPLLDAVLARLPNGSR